MRPVVLGIDLGTTFCAMSRVGPDGMPEIVANSEGQLTTPSVVLFRDHEVLVGQEALARVVMEPEHVVRGIKRSMGDSEFTIHGRTPEEVSAEILRKLKKDGEAALNARIEQAVITVPAYFDDIRRRATRHAGELAGLQVTGLPNEPTAAAVFYGVRRLSADSTILVYDLGGGTFDATVLRFDGSEFHVMDSDGNRELGGDDWTTALTDHAAEQYERVFRVSPQEDQRTYQTLRESCERAKRDLAVAPLASVSLSNEGRVEPLIVKPEEFDSLTAPLVEETMICVHRVMDRAGITWERVDNILLVGGSTRLRAVPRALERESGRKPVAFDSPDLIVAKGAALYAGAQEDAGSGSLVIRAPESGAGIRLQEATAHGLGIIIADNATVPPVLKSSLLLPAGTGIPAEVSRTYALPGACGDSFKVPVVQCEADGVGLEACNVNKTYEFSGWGGERPQRIKVTYRYSRDAEIDLEAETEQGLPLARRVVAFEAPPTSQTRGGSASVVICLDTSSSMGGEPLEEAKREFERVLKEVGASGRHVGVGLISFGGRARVEASVTSDLNSLKTVVAGLHARGGTPMDAALKSAREELRGTSGSRAVILISDGMPNDPEATSARAGALARDSVPLYVVSIGDDGARFLESIGTEFREIVGTSGLSVAILEFLESI